MKKFMGLALLLTISSFALADEGIPISGTVHARGDGGSDLIIKGDAAKAIYDSMGAAQVESPKLSPVLGPETVTVRYGSAGLCQSTVKPLQTTYDCLISIDKDGGTSSLPPAL